MGCTAEVVYVDGRNVIVGHVGDSRTYHLHEGRLIQLTRDQTLVNRLVELGTLTAEEAETHPRRNELQQAIGGQPDVEPGMYHGVLKPGDWVLVCSDGLTNHINAMQLKEMLLSEAQSAETGGAAAGELRQLIEGATDNATVVVVRATSIIRICSISPVGQATLPVLRGLWNRSLMQILVCETSSLARGCGTWFVLLAAIAILPSFVGFSTFPEGVHHGAVA